LRKKWKAGIKLANKISPAEDTASGQRTVSRVGFWTAILTTLFAAVALATAIATPPRSGPFCVSSCVTYPYTDVAAFVPRDYFWMVPASLMMLLFFLLMVCIHSNTNMDKSLFSQIGLSFALTSVVAIAVDYYIQLAVIQPSLLRGEMKELALFTQYNPHGIFIALENLGYLMMSLAFLFEGAVFAGTNRLERAIHWLLIIGSWVVIGVFLILSVVYGQDLEYRFEVFVITINWILLMVAGVMLSIYFKRVARSGAFR
jgi:hypothetical protein